MSGTKTAADLEKKVTVSHDGRPSVDPNYLIQTREAQAHLKAISRVAVSSPKKTATATTTPSKKEQ